MTDTKKIVEEQINQAWARGTNWAMQGRGYALDTNADTQAEVLIELFRKIHEEARVEILLELLQMFKDYDAPITMMRDILVEYLAKKD